MDIWWATEQRKCPVFFPQTLLPFQFTVEEFKTIIANSGTRATLCKTRFSRVSDNQWGCGAYSTPINEYLNRTTFSWFN